MPRFFVESLEEDTLVLSGEDGRHIAKSLRQQPGEELELCDGRGTDALAVIRGISGEQVTAEIRERRPSRGELPCRVTLYQALPKGDKLVFIVQKAVELGAAAIVPVLTSRCISRPDRQGMEKKRERLGKIAWEAAGVRMLTLTWNGPNELGSGHDTPGGLTAFGREAVAEMAKSPCPILFYERANTPLGAVLAPRPPEIALLVGAEGGFSPEEAQEAAAAGLSLCTMGPRILRCETAPLYALSAIGYAYENSAR